MTDREPTPQEEIRSRLHGKRDSTIVSLDGINRSKEKDEEIDLAIAGLFAGKRGDQVLDYLELITIRRVLPPDTPSSQLHYMEGARWIVGLLRARLKRGRDAEKLAKPVSGTPPRTLS